MKLETKKEPLFTFEDFEKGLMIAGYITPQNEMEIKEREAVYEYEKELSKDNSKIYFKRIVLAAEIVNQLYQENTFGRVKFQKLVYLCENASNMGINKRYLKFAAGPFDNKFMHSINKEFKEHKWFNVEVVKDGIYTKWVYSPLDNVEDYKKYYTQYFSKYNETIQQIISLFRKQKTNYVELVATIYACCLEIINSKKEFSNDRLFEIFYSWADEKKKFKESEVLSALDWMNANDLIPE